MQTHKTSGEAARFVVARGLYMQKHKTIGEAAKYVVARGLYMQTQGMTNAARCTVAVGLHVGTVPD